MPDNIWFTGCRHFSHENKSGKGIIQYKQRPFKSILEHDEALVSNYNNCVKDGDTVFDLGDFALTNVTRIKELLKSLKGEKALILGDHDRTISKNYKEFVSKDMLMWLRTRYELMLKPKPGSQKGKKIVLSHYPMLSWNGKAYDRSWQLYSHSHGDIDMHNGLLSFDVSVDSVAKYLKESRGGDNLLKEDYRPFSIDEILGVIREISASAISIGSFIINK